MTSHDIAVIGAGIGGLSFALGALKRGHRVRIYEQAPAIAVVGGGISIAPNPMKVLLALGLRDALNEVACWPRHGTIRNGKTGAHVTKTDFTGYEEKFGAPYMQIHRADLHACLLNAARAIDPHVLVLGKSFAGLQEGGEGVRVTFGDGGTAKADVLVGADGVKSRVRAALFGERPARFTGVVAWRGTVPMENLPDESRVLDSNVWTLPDRQIVQHPVCAGKLMHVSGLASGQPWFDESWTARSTLDEVLAAFDGFSPVVRAMVAAIAPDQCYKWALHDRDPLPTWSKGRVTLLGDAAHPMLPFLAQGAAMAIEDGFVLAEALSSGMSDVEAALASYVALRRDRASYVQLEARRARERLCDLGRKEVSFEGDTPLKQETLFGWDPNEAVTALSRFDVRRSATTAVHA
jgi:salicylate hydroxylase